MMAQFLKIKEAHPGALLFYRMGDFYELFFDDAVKASAALDITLTKRGKHQGEDIPMCGVPVHSAEGYLSRLIRRGFRVAICEQVESPEEAKKRGGAKALVKRDVVRIVTPGTITEEALLDARQNNYLAAVADVRGAIGLAWVDVSTGDFRVQPVAAGGLAAALARLEPGEIVLPEKLARTDSLQPVWSEWRGALTPQPDSRFNSDNAERRLQKVFDVASLDGFGDLARPEVAAAGALLDYIELTQKGRIPRLKPPRKLSDGAALEIDAATRRNLELARTLTGGREGSLLGEIDRTVTGPGARLMAARLAMPLTDISEIGARLDMVEYLGRETKLREETRAKLRECPDMERAVSRLTLDRGGPRDLAAVRDGLSAAEEMQRLLEKAPDLPEGLAAAQDRLGGHATLIRGLADALADDLPLLARDGGFVAKGHSADLDEHRALRDESRKLIAGLESDYREATGIAALKVKHNNVLGYFVEVTDAHGEKLRARDDFIHRQTMAKAVRFSTVALSELEDKIGRAGEKAQALELEIFARLVADVLDNADAISATAGALAAIDVAAGLAELAVERRFSRPKLTDALEFSIEGGRHPVVEAALARDNVDSFVANGCDLGPDQRLWLITGPNMAGKSTFLRQNALIAILAQTGSFVPADTATIGVIDRVFSRVGASDDLARGRSTFMVEMVETAAILNQATERSLVILDEIGRGTATYDGLSIAWAAVEHLHDSSACRALFATHYHELTALAARLPALSCHTMRVKEWEGDVVFLHEVAAGVADRSYGIHVAKLAGLPPAVVARAQQVLETLEKEEQSGELAKLADDLPLFSAASQDGGSAKIDPRIEEIETLLGAVNPDELAPREALDLIYRLRAILSG